MKCSISKRFSVLDPGEPKLSSPGFDFASATNSATLFARIGDKDAGHVRDLGDRREVLLRVDRQVRKDRGIDRDRADVAEIDRVTVGGRLGGELHADIARRAGAVVDDDLLAEEFGELRRNDPRHEIRGAARGEGNDHPDRPIRVACLPECKRGTQRQREHHPHAQLFHDSSPRVSRAF